MTCTADVIQALQLIRCLFLCVCWRADTTSDLVSWFPSGSSCTPASTSTLTTHIHTLMMLDVTDVGRWQSLVWTETLTLGPLWPAAPAGPGGPWETHYNHMSAHVYTYICAVMCLYDSLSLLSCGIVFSVTFFPFSPGTPTGPGKPSAPWEETTTRPAVILSFNWNIHPFIICSCCSHLQALTAGVTWQTWNTQLSLRREGQETEKTDKKRKCVCKTGVWYDKIFSTDYYCGRLFHLFSSDACGSRFTQGTTLPFGALRTVLTAHPWSTRVSLTDTDGVHSMFKCICGWVCVFRKCVLCLHVITVSPLAPISPLAPGKPSSPWTQHTYIHDNQSAWWKAWVLNSYASETSEKHLHN